MAKRQEVFLREWDLGRGTELTLENLKEEMREIVNASGLDVSIFETSFQNRSALAVSGKSEYMNVYHYLDGTKLMVEVVGKGEQVRAEDLASLFSKAVAYYQVYSYAKRCGGGGLAAGVGAATTVALRSGFKAVAKGVRVLLRDREAWEKEMAFYQNTLGIGDYVIGGEDSNYLLPRIKAQAEADNVTAQYVLGVAYDLGRGVTASDETSMQWFAKAAANGHQMSRIIVAQEYLFSEKKYDTSQKETAINYLHCLAEDGNIWAMDSLLDVFAKGNVDGIPADYVKTEQIAGKFADQGHFNSAMTLAQLYDGTLTEDAAAIRNFHDDAKAAFLYKAIADDENFSDCKVEAAYRLARMYQEGRGTTKNVGEAVHYYECAAALGNIDAKAVLTESYTFGVMTEQNAAKAEQYADELIKAADEKYLSVAYYCKYILADQAGEYKKSMDAARRYASLSHVVAQKKQEVEEYLRRQQEKISRMSEEERRAYLKEPPKKNWIKYALIGGGVLLAIIIAVAIVSNMNSGDDYRDYDDSGYSEEYYDDNFSYDESYDDSEYDDFGDDMGYAGEIIASYGTGVASEQDALEIAEMHFYGEMDGNPEDNYPDLEFDCYPVDNGGYVVKAMNGIDEATDEPWVIWSVLVTSEGDLYYWNDGSTDWMD